MEAFGIVEIIDPVGHCDGQLEARGPLPRVQQLCLHSPPERLDGSVVEAVANGSEGGNQIVPAKVLSERPGCELSTVVDMQYSAVVSFPFPDGHIHRIIDQSCVRDCRKRPPDNLFAEAIESRAAIDLSITSGMLGDVRAPQLVRLVRDEHAVHQVRWRMNTQQIRFPSLLERQTRELQLT